MWNEAHDSIGRGPSIALWRHPATGPPAAPTPSAQLGELALQQGAEGVLLVGHDPGGRIGGEVLEAAPGLVERGGLDLPERRDILIHERAPARRGLLRDNKSLVL